MATSTQWQLAREAPERYEEILVPPILGVLLPSSGFAIRDNVIRTSIHVETRGFKFMVY